MATTLDGSRVRHRSGGTMTESLSGPGTGGLPGSPAPNSELPRGRAAEGATTAAGAAQANGKKRTGRGSAPRPSFSQVILNVGFISALILAAGAFATGGFHLSSFLSKSSEGIGNLWKAPGDAKGPPRILSPSEMRIAIGAQVSMARLGLLSCGIFVGMAFGFLGFSLFLIGVRDEMELEAQSRSQAIRLARLAPGVFVILCSTVLIGVCATDSRTMKWDITTESEAIQADPQSAATDEEPKEPLSTDQAASIPAIRKRAQENANKHPSPHTNSQSQ